MGPQPSSRGNASVARRVRYQHEASMGPQPSSRGNASRCPATPTSMAASMGPQPSSRGNRAGLPPTSTQRTCFNGAATFQSRKLEFSENEAKRETALQWGRNLPVAEIVSGTLRGAAFRRRFNGAATFQSRKFTGCWTTPLGCRSASMGPQPSSRGNLS